MPNCALLTIGSELLNGQTLNTNALYLCQRLDELNVDVLLQTSCKDDASSIHKALNDALKSHDMVLVTGGLGPTPDDITRKTIANYFDSKLVFNKKQYDFIVKYFKSLKKKTPFLTRQEAYFPSIAKPLLNPFGIALGFYIYQLIYDKKRLIVVLPGVPRELKGMYQASVKKLIKQLFKKRPRYYQLQAKIVGLSETKIMRILGRSFFKGRQFDFGIYPQMGEVMLRIKTSKPSLIPILKKEIIRKFKDLVYSFDSKSLAELICSQFISKRKTLTVAESCTSGLLAKRLTDPSGASRFFVGGIIAYSNQVKEKVIGVDHKMLKDYGAVSPQVAKSLAMKVRVKFKASLGVSITGIAGPTGGTAQKPVGLVYIGISDQNKTKSYVLRLPGGKRQGTPH